MKNEWNYTSAPPISFHGPDRDHFPFLYKGKAVPLQACTGPEGSRRMRLPYQDNRHMKMVTLSALRTGRLYLQGNIPGTHFCKRLSQPQGHSAAGRIMSMKNSNDTVGNRSPRPFDLQRSASTNCATAYPVYIHLFLKKWGGWKALAIVSSLWYLPCWSFKLCDYGDIMYINTLDTEHSCGLTEKPGAAPFLPNVM